MITSRFRGHDRRMTPCLSVHGPVSAIALRVSCSFNIVLHGLVVHCAICFMFDCLCPVFRYSLTCGTPSLRAWKIVQAFVDTLSVLACFQSIKRRLNSNSNWAECIIGLILDSPRKIQECTSLNIWIVHLIARLPSRVMVSETTTNIHWPFLQWTCHVYICSATWLWK